MHVGLFKTNLLLKVLNVCHIFSYKLGQAYRNDKGDILNIKIKIYNMCKF